MSEETFNRLEITPIDFGAFKQKDMGSESDELIYLSVGRLLSKWETVETVMAHFFGLLVESDSQAAIRAYGLITSVAQRCNLLKEAASIFSDRHKDIFSLEEFKTLSKNYVNCSVRRNAVAHGLVSSFNFNDGKDDRGYFLAPPYYNTKQNEAKTLSFWQSLQGNENLNPFDIFGQKYRYTHDDINYFRSNFELLSKQLNGYYMHLMLTLEQQKFDRAPASQKASIRIGQKKKVDKPE